MSAEGTAAGLEDPVERLLHEVGHADRAEIDGAAMRAAPEEHGDPAAPHVPVSPFARSPPRVRRGRPATPRGAAPRALCASRRAAARPPAPPGSPPAFSGPARTWCAGSWPGLLGAYAVWRFVCSCLPRPWPVRLRTAIELQGTRDTIVTVSTVAASVGIATSRRGANASAQPPHGRTSTRLRNGQARRSCRQRGAGQRIR